MVANGTACIAAAAEIILLYSPGGANAPIFDTWFLWPMLVVDPNNISIGLAVLVGLTGVPNRQTHKLYVTTSVTIAHIPYYARIHAFWGTVSFPYSCVIVYHMFRYT